MLHKRSRHLGGVICAGLLLSLGLTLLPGEGSPLSIERAEARSVVVRPHTGQRVRAHPLTVVVRSRDRVRDLRAKLNGKSISRDFGRTRHGKRHARISRSHGLKRGRNVLRVKVRRRNGKRRKQTVRFRIAHNRPIAGAGRDRRIVEGQGFRLHGSALPSRHSGHRIGYRWTLAHAPKQSRFGKQGGAGGAQSKGAFLPTGSGPPTGTQGGARHTRRPRFLPDVNGTYRLKLRASQSSRSTVDTVKYDAVPKTPLVPIETMPGERASGKPAAVKVGNDSYAPDPVARAWLQVIVLDRKTLDPVPNGSNKTYTCPRLPCAPAVANDLSNLTDKQLVIAVSHAGFTNPFSLPQALAGIGFPQLDANSFGTAPGGTVSTIGVPGLPAGEADVNFVPDGKPGDGDMDGYLTSDEYKNYTWLPKERPLFDTRKSSVVQGKKGNVIEVGGQSYPSGVPPFSAQVPGAFQVLVLDGHTLDGVGNQTIFTNCGSSSCGLADELDNLKDLLNVAGPDSLVFVSSISAAGQPLFDPNTPAGLVNDFAAKIASVGGTRHVFNRRALDHTGTSNYSLAGWVGAGEGAGEETSNLKDPRGPGDARLRGALTRDHQSFFKPAGASIVDQPNEALAQLVVKPESGKWPLDGNAGAQRAISYIGSKDNRLGADDPRSAYWIQDFDQSDWTKVGDAVNGVAYPGDGNGFTADEFNAAKVELLKEIDWVGRTRSYLAKLSSPFADNALSSWTNLQAIGNDVSSALKPSGSTILYLLNVMEVAMDLGGIEHGPAMEAVNVLYYFAIDHIAEDQNGSDIDEVKADAGKLAGELISRLDEAKLAFKRMGDIVVSDYEKLSTVGTLALCNPASSGCPKEWAFGSADAQDASAAIYRSAESSFSQSFMTKAFPAYRLDPSAHTNAGDFKCTVGRNFARVVAFPDISANDQAALLVNYPSTYQVHFLGQDIGQFAGDPEPNFPPGGTVNRMFGPVADDLNPKKGGLGIYAPDFLREANPRAYVHPNIVHFCGWPEDL